MGGGRKRAKRGALGMRSLTPFTMAVRNKLYGRDTYPPQVMCHYLERPYWVQISDDAIRFFKFKYPEVMDLADEFVELYGVSEEPTTTTDGVDLALRLRWKKFIKSKFDPERVSAFKNAPGYIGPGRGVQTVIQGIKEYEYAKVLAKRREEKRARQAKS